ncbi:imidazole glycerol phosphate synthase subunit HisH [Biformimicrobium ophioploci]|uniref:Imidazole glycerol phosphate synthase subunit HisH n=1 Tax=Biformimicrobium ophioploci TaxID=3036711 RepID=A0ABQ6LW52_9GAMM|nr:imidazole glycerol phosphate synthase subunit HisH [Microbulbifer sp. NKW57]GMG86257.1 imidazole glycerol phosphate synthase subunit HisH [Microbulbifer sp. NKW57]
MQKQTIAILDYGMGNLHSVASALHLVAPDADVRLVQHPSECEGADRLIVPGVGAMRDCMAGFENAGFAPLLRDALEAGLPVLGICVGMQILMHHSEENGGVDCLNIFPQPVLHFGELPGPDGHNLKVPHMGWNRVQQHQAHPLWQGIEDGSRFYFVHSYYVPAEGNPNACGTTGYGVQLAAAVADKNLFACQFHPEKSGDAGLQLLRNFVNWQP